MDYKCYRQLVEDIKFFCWQLDIVTAVQLAEFKKKHNCNTVEEIHTALCKEYNKQHCGNVDNFSIMMLVKFCLV